MAEALTLAKIPGTEQVDRALGDAALHRCFAHVDLKANDHARAARF